VELGSQVHKGDLLVELSVGEISAKVQQSNAQLEQARRNLTREENMLKKNAATPETVKSLRDALRIAEAAHREAVTMFDYARITAPFSGIITKKIANIGDLATPGKVLLNMEEENNLQVLTAIPEAMLLKIKKGDRLPISIPSADISVEGTVAEVSPIADPSSRTAPIKLRVAPNPNLRSGQFARVALTMPEVTTLAIPPTAVVLFGQMESVFVVVDNHAAMRLIRTGTRWKDGVEILSGLTGDELVITSGNTSLVDGQPVATH
jgi:RND family efflux transporter MFP subunit